MSEIDLKQLREIRRRAQNLLRFVDSDLQPFIHKQDKETFRRKPESPSTPNDVNVTTTCSCVMALALTNKFRTFYKDKIRTGTSIANEDRAKTMAESLFQRLIDAPWMSSGLTANNAFSTSLVIRTFGFLKENQILPDESSLPKKTWDLNFGVKNILDFARYLTNRPDELAKFVYSSISDKSRSLIQKIVGNDTDDLKNQLTNSLTLDLQRLVQFGSIFTPERFPKAAKATIADLDHLPTGYTLACINRKLFVEQCPEFLQAPPQLSLEEIAKRLAEDPHHFCINEYSATATVVYWFVDGLERGGITIGKAAWDKLCQWASQEFNRERSLVLAGHDAMMNPVAMAMAASLCAKLRKIAARAELGTAKAHREMLPSVVELEHSVLELIRHQAPSGIWPKYFPLFHYQDAGSNFCFTFEMLESVLCEFGHTDNSLLDQELFVDGLGKAVTWCERNRLKCSEESVEYSGWNSGGGIESLKKERPESWATAVVHMFLLELTEVFSRRIQKRLLYKYAARAPKMTAERMQEEIRRNDKWKDQNFGKSLDKLQDINLFLDRKHESLIDVLKNELLSKHFVKTEAQIRRNGITEPVSALLFGPPGTSKTQITKAIAEDLGWPMIEINPSEFVKGNFANVYLQADEIFKDLMDLDGVVILFDEMDALTQKRGPAGKDSGNSHLDTATQFLTTSMLPKLTALHDRKGCVFFMATNFQENFDQAIKRAGRFDYLICMGPPTLEQKISKLECFFENKPSDDQKRRAVAAIRTFLEGSTRFKIIFELLTYGDCKSFLKRFGDGGEIGEALERAGKEKFQERLDEYGDNIVLKYSHWKLLGRGDISLTEIDQLSEDEFKRMFSHDGIKGSDLAQYLSDRRVSRRQV